MITVCDQLQAMTEIADSLNEAADALTDALIRMGAQHDLLLESEKATAEDIAAAHTAVETEIAALRALVTDLRHQEDCINTDRLRIRDLAAMRKIHAPHNCPPL